MQFKTLIAILGAMVVATSAQSSAPAGYSAAPSGVAPSSVAPSGAAAPTGGYSGGGSSNGTWGGGSTPSNGTYPVGGGSPGGVTSSSPTPSQSYVSATGDGTRFAAGSLLGLAVVGGIALAM